MGSDAGEHVVLSWKLVTNFLVGGGSVTVGAVVKVEMYLHFTDYSDNILGSFPLLKKKLSLKLEKKIFQFLMFLFNFCIMHSGGSICKIYCFY